MRTTSVRWRAERGDAAVIAAGAARELGNLGRLLTSVEEVKDAEAVLACTVLPEMDDQ